MIRMEYFWWVY